MPEELPRISNAEPVLTHARDRKIETILHHWFPLLQFHETVQIVERFMKSAQVPLSTSNSDRPSDYLQQVEPKRQFLIALSDTELETTYQRVLREINDQKKRRLADAEARRIEQERKKEAARFYNQPEAQADLEYWAKMNFWTLDEAIALLLGKNPKIVTPSAIEREISRSFSILEPNPRSKLTGFLDLYIKLRDLAVRAQDMQGPQIAPQAAVAWARRHGLIEIPSILNQRFPAKSNPPSELTDPAALPSEIDIDSSGTGKKWTPVRIAELAAYRELHGTKAAAEHFGISTARIRQLQPQPKQDARVNSPFNLTPRKK